MDEQLIVLTVNKKGEHNHLTSFNEIHLSSNNGENSNNGETSTNINNDSEIPRRLIGKERIKFFAFEELHEVHNAKAFFAFSRF